MKVRLKQYASAIDKVYAEFQFHEGPIKTYTLDGKQLSGITFQFHEGPIKTSLMMLFHSCINCFNSMKVRLKHTLPIRQFSVPRFNSMKVRLKPAEDGVLRGSRNCFNSMKVRLKPVRAIFTRRTILFQFHEGPIKTVEICTRHSLRCWFQFHEGPIKTTSYRLHQQVGVGFNSMKVRLKHNKQVMSVIMLRFQFHEGPIKTLYYFQIVVLQKSFNSMKVRLKLSEILQIVWRKTQFQFHEGPIKTFDFECREHGLIMFQFHEGPIKTLVSVCLLTSNCCFNSMKVRLKHNKQVMSVITLGFQFHEGPIKTLFSSFRLSFRIVFQFHEGPIKTWRIS